MAEIDTQGSAEADYLRRAGELYLAVAKRFEEASPSIGEFLAATTAFLSHRSECQPQTENIMQNTNRGIEEFCRAWSARKFDLETMRVIAEHSPFLFATIFARIKGMEQEPFSARMQFIADGF